MPTRTASMPVCLLALVLGGCGATDQLAGLSEDSSCKDFMEAEPSARIDAINTIYEKRHGDTNSMGAANALGNTEYVCGQAPDRKLKDVSF